MSDPVKRANPPSPNVTAHTSLQWNTHAKIIKRIVTVTVFKLVDTGIPNRNLRTERILPIAMTEYYRYMNRDFPTLKLCAQLRLNRLLIGPQNSRLSHNIARKKVEHFQMLQAFLFLVPISGDSGTQLGR